MFLIVDSHEDLAWNLLTFERDYSRSAAETRQREKDQPMAVQAGEELLGWPDYQRGQVAVVFSTLFAAPARRRVGKWENQIYPDNDYESAYRLYFAQLMAYHRLGEEYPEKFHMIQFISDLDELLSDWEKPTSTKKGHPVGLVVLMEGAEAIRSLDELDEWWSLGLRAIGPAWAGTRYCGGTLEPGPLSKEGHDLLDEMAKFNFALDLSHMDEEAALQALDAYPGPVMVSHGNCAALLPDVDTNRHLTDRLIRGILEREGVIGVVPYNRFLKAGWEKGDPRQGILLEHLIPHIDHICQMAGEASHVGIGSDFDGGFGLQSIPEDVDTIADLQNLVPLLTRRGYSEDDIASILSGNWLDHLRSWLPES